MVEMVVGVVKRSNKRTFLKWTMQRLITYSALPVACRDKYPLIFHDDGPNTAKPKYSGFADINLS